MNYFSKPEPSRCFRGPWRPRAIVPREYSRKGSSMDERELLASADTHIFRARMDAKELTGPILERGSGSVVWDVTGKAYLDFNSGQMCSALGHNHPRIVAAIQEATQKLIHASSSLLNINEIRLAETLASTVPAPLQKSFFLLSGSDANEAALAVAKKYTGRFEVASPHTGFHGLSESARAVTFSGWHQGYGPYPPGTYGILAPYCYRCPVQHTFPQCEFACLKASFELLDAECAAPLGAYWRGHLQRLAERYELIGDVRGCGLIQGLELVWDRGRKTAAFEAGLQIAQTCLQKGLLCSVRRGGSVLRFVPPFTTTTSQFDQAAEILEQAIQGVRC